MIAVTCVAWNRGYIYDVTILNQKMSSTGTGASSAPCVHSFYFLQDALLPDFLTSRSGDTRGPSMETLLTRISQYATENPAKFIALSSFFVLGGVPIIGFLAYAVATIVASLIGAVVLELILLGIGITGLVFVLLFVTCISLCATSIFMAVYYSYQVASKTWSKSKRSLAWPVRRPPNTVTDRNDETQSNTEQSEETFDKTK